MSEMFSVGANLKGLLETEEPLSVSNVVHKAFIDVNEKGATAAGGSGKQLQHSVGGFNLNLF